MLDHGTEDDDDSPTGGRIDGGVGYIHTYVGVSIAGSLSPSLRPSLLHARGCGIAEVSLWKEALGRTHKIQSCGSFFLIRKVCGISTEGQ
jgi:hypothetical protein